jgi:hypothetical protein
MALATLLEPLLIVAMGAVVMLIVLAVLLPIIQGCERYTADCTALRRAGGVVRPCGREPAASSRLASAPHHGTLGPVQLPFPG